MGETILYRRGTLLVVWAKYFDVHAGTGKIQGRATAFYSRELGMAGNLILFWARKRGKVSPILESTQNRFDVREVR